MQQRITTTALCLFTVLLVMIQISFADTVSIPNTFVNGTVADADEVNANFAAVKAAVNDNDSSISASQSSINSIQSSVNNLLNSISPTGNGTLEIESGSGSFRIVNFPASSKSTVVKAVFNGINAGPQVRFTDSRRSEFIDIGLDGAGNFVIENEFDIAQFSVNKNGLVKIGQNSGTGRLTVNSPTSSNATVIIRGRTGDFVYLNVVQPGGQEIFRVLDESIQLLVGNAFKPGGGSWAGLSDERVKKDIKELGGALDRLTQLRSVTYKFIDPASLGESPGTHIGFTAQQVEKVFPEWVSEHNGLKYVAPTGFEALTVAALSELRKEKDSEITSLRNENQDMGIRLEKLEQALRALTDQKSLTILSKPQLAVLDEKKIIIDLGSNP